MINQNDSDRLLEMILMGRTTRPYSDVENTNVNAKNEMENGGRRRNNSQKKQFIWHPFYISSFNR